MATASACVGVIVSVTGIVVVVEGRDDELVVWACVVCGAWVVVVVVVTGRTDVLVVVGAEDVVVVDSATVTGSVVVVV